jgi:hypothetical protein
MAPKVADVLLFFAPELWGEVERFSNLSRETYKFDERGSAPYLGFGSISIKRARSAVLPRN